MRTLISGDQRFDPLDLKISLLVLAQLSRGRARHATQADPLWRPRNPEEEFPSLIGNSGGFCL